jgi:hypothetical protein
MFSPMNRVVPICLIICAALTAVTAVSAQKTRVPPQAKAKPAEKYFPGTVVDERLSVLRMEPSLYSIPLQRMRRGRTVLIYSSKVVDGVTFYYVSVPPDKRGWVQAEAVASAGRIGDDARLVKLIQASAGFDQIERAVLFLETFPNSTLRPAMLLYLGDMLEDTAQKLTFEAHKRLDKSEMEASGAPISSFFLNYAGLDRYRRLGVTFLFDPSTKYFHYNGDSWKEVVAHFPGSNDAVEAKKRLAELEGKMPQQK